MAFLCRSLPIFWGRGATGAKQSNPSQISSFVRCFPLAVRAAQFPRAARPDESLWRLAPCGEFQGDFMRNGRLTVQASVQAASISGFLFCGLLAVSAPAARADVYHAVAQGETLATVAAKYRVSSSDLRAANGLKGEDNSALPAMLLRVPGVQEGSAPTLAGMTQAAAPAISGNASLGGAVATGTGFIARTMSETVRAGDTWDAIAARYIAAGYDVSANSLRNRNNSVALVAGATVVVPLDKTNYAAPAYAHRRRWRSRRGAARFDGRARFPRRRRFQRWLRKRRRSSRPMRRGVRWAMAFTHRARPICRSPKMPHRRRRRSFAPVRAGHWLRVAVTGSWRAPPSAAACRF